MARNEQLIRQHKVLEILERSRYGRTLEEIRDSLVDELGLSSLHTRSVRRDLQALQAAGFDVDVHDAARGKIWKLGPRAKSTHRISATASELIALSLGRDLLYPLAGTPFWSGIESFWNKIQEELPETVWDHYQRFRKSLFVLGTTSKSYENQQGILSTLNRSIQQHRVVEITYQPIGKDARTRLIEPYGVVFFQSSLYIIAADHASKESERMRHFKLDRFTKADGLDQWFEVDRSFDLREYLGQSLGIFGSNRPMNFRIRISPSAARWVQEDPWHSEQTIDHQPDGGILLRVKVAHEMAIIPRVLALGTNAEVLSPASCRKRIATMIDEMARSYA